MASKGFSQSYHNLFVDFLNSLRIQKKVIHALILREIITRYGRHNLGFMWLFVEPMVFTLGVAFVFNLIHRGHSIAPQIPIAAVVLTGYSTILLWRNMPNRCLEAVSINSGLLFHRNVKPLDIFLSRLILEAVGATISLIALTFLFSLLGLVELPKNYFLVVIGWLLLTWYGFAFSIFVGCLSERFEILEKIMHPFQYLMIPLSGAFFIVSMIPKNFQDILVYIPMVNCVEIIRHGFFGDIIPWIYSFSYVIVFNLILSFLAAIELHKIKNHVFLSA